MTTESMYGMINEKKNIKMMREDFEKRKDALLRNDQEEFETSCSKSIAAS